MRSLRSGVAVAAIVAMWSSSAFGFNLFGSSDDSGKKPKPAPQAQAQQQQAQPQDQAADQPSIAKSLAVNLDTEIEKAKTQRALGDYGGAAHALAQMMLVAPDDARVVSEYGKVLVLLGRSDDAIAFLKRAIDLSPNDWTLYSAIGAAFDQESKFTEAQTAYQRGLQIKPDSAALLNNYAMSRMLAGDLPGAQALIARAQALGNDPKIAHNASLMANLRGDSAPQAAAMHPVVASVIPAAKETPKPAIPAAPVQATLPKPVSTASLPPAAKPDVNDVKQAAVASPAPPAAKPAPAAKAEPVKAAAIVKPEPVKTASAPALKPEPAKTAAAPIVKAEPVKTASAPIVKAEPAKTAIASVVKPEPVKAVSAAAVKPEPVKAATIAAPAPVKTASLPAADKPVIVKTETGRVMMQAVPKDPAAGPVNAAPQTPKPAAAPAQEAKTQEAKIPDTNSEANAPPRALAQATPGATKATPDLRAAAD
ncbi:MAG TPA: tetratricopeptide repeat protein [Rhizomicrobium sp.]|nr:tetratricopeptide repeat protein [Rhizomicrobium sp.]